MLRAFIRLSCILSLAHTGASVLPAQTATPPSLTSISPNNRTAGDPAFNVFINGSGFHQCTRIRWNGQDLPLNGTPSATFISGQVSAVLIATPGIVTVTAFRYNFNAGGSTCTSTGVASSNSLTFIVNNPLNITTSSPLPVGRIGQSYGPLQLQATGGTSQATYTWGLNQGSTLPPGLSLNANGVISGTPTQVGNFTFTIRVVDCVIECTPHVDTQVFTLAVQQNALTIAPASLPGGAVCASYSQQITVTGGTPPYSLQATGLPPGLVLSSGNTITGRPTQTGNSTVTIRATDSANVQGSQTYSLVIGGSTFQISTSSLPSGRVGTSYNQTVAATGGVPPYTWSATQAPQGLTVSTDTDNGRVAGTPTQPGTFNTQFRVTDAVSCVATRAIPIAIVAGDPQIITTTLNSGQVGAPYTQTLQGEGGTTPYTWSVASGQLPAGLGLNAAGVITGTPQAAGSFNFVVQLVDSAQARATRNFTLQITTGLVITTTALPPARLGQPYEVALQASGGSGGLTWSAPGGLPAGFALSPSGVLTGTAASAGDFSLGVRVQDSTGAAATRSYLLSVLTALTVITESLPNAQSGVAYTATLGASGGTAPYRWQAIGELPPGLTLDPFGVLAGTPTQVGSFPVQVQVVDSQNGNASKLFTLVVTSQFRITTEGLPNGSVGVFYNSLLQSIGGRAPIRWGQESGQLPLGLILNSNTGTLAGTPQESGEFRFTIFAVDADQLRTSRNYTVTIRGQFTITTQSLPSGSVGIAYSQTIATTGGSSPFRWSVTEGALPGGLQLGAASGVLAGTPTAAGTFTFAVQATDNASLQARQQYTLVINQSGFTITTQSLPNGTVGTAYSQTIASTGGTAPLRWTVLEGTLPAGLQLGAANGTITGTPTTAGASTFTIQAIDNANLQARQQYTVTIIGPPRIVTESLPPATLGTSYVAVLEAAGGETPYTWSQTGLPLGLALDAATGEISGTPERAGSANVTITIRDSANRSATRQFTLVVASGLSIVIEPLPSARVGIVYSQTLQAAGGSAPFSWTVVSGALPPGVTLAASGVLQGTPSRSGDFTFTVQVRDSQGSTASQQLSIRVAELGLSGITIRTASLQAGAGDQPAIALELAEPAPAALAGTLALTFASDAGGVTDPALQFSQGGPTPSFTIPQGSRAAAFPGGGLNLQLGTVAGTATLTARMTAGGVDVTPAPAPSLTLRIDRGVPVINTMTLSRTATTLTVELTGFATSRELTSADFQFAIRQGATVQTSNFTVQLAAPFTEWYRGANSVTFGSAFRLTMPFTVTGSTADITGVTVTLVNAVGRSQARTGTF